jgi:hypothetical protein
MASGSFSGSYKGFTLKTSWTSEKNIAGNYSTITCTHYLICAQYYSLYINGRTNSCTVNGEKKEFSSSAISVEGSKTITLGTTTYKVYHNTDGKKSVSASTVFNIQATIVDTYVGSITASGTMVLDNIPRYATSNQSLKSKTETSITMNWSSDSTVDYIWYSKDNGSNWTGINVTDGKSGSYTISGLSANTTYKIKTRVRRKDSQLTTDSSALSVTTYNYPYCTKAPDFTIGNKLTLSFYNPLGRTFKLEVIGANGVVKNVNDYSTTSVGGFNNTSWQDYWYSTIPNAKSGTYKVRVTYGSSVITITGGTYSIKGTETPIIGNITYADTNTNVTAITGNPAHIVQNQSNFMVGFSMATAQSYASISKHTFELNGVTKTTTSLSGTVDFGKINSSENLTLTVTVTDSRGLTAKITKTITMLAHSNPTAIVSLNRLNNYEDETYLTVDGSISSVNSKNTMTIKYRYKLSGGNYNDFVIIGDRAKQTLFLDKNNSYVFNVVVTDAFGSSFDKEYALGKGVFPLFIDTALNSIGINKLPTKPNALEIEGKIYGSQNHLLWEGAELMAKDTTITLAEPVSEQANGIVLIFTACDDGAVLNSCICSFFKSKIEVNKQSGKGHSFFLFGGSAFERVASKYCYIYNNEIPGNVNNTKAGTSNGIIYDNNRFVLRYVIGV